MYLEFHTGYKLRNFNWNVRKAIYSYQEEKTQKEQKKKRRKKKWLINSVLS